MDKPDLVQLRQRMRENLTPDEASVVATLREAGDPGRRVRREAGELAEQLVTAIRDHSQPALMETFLAEYGLSSDEGIALMCLAEALLRVPDDATVDALIHDKIVPADWGTHLGQSSSSLVNASTWALMLTGKIIADEHTGVAGVVSSLVRRLGEPVVRTAVNQAIRELGNQFVLGTDIEHAVKRSEIARARGYTHSYDMLGEAAKTDDDARRFHLAYSQAISSLGSSSEHDSVAENPGISVKLSALYPRYEYLQKKGVMVELVARTRSLAMLAKSANMGFNIDAEEADRLDLSLDVIEQVLQEPSLANWDGFGIVVQAYSPRAWHVIDWLYELAGRCKRKIMIRLVKGAYWDSEIKRAQVDGIAGFPVFTRKAHTDISYIACARKLLGMTDRIYPQFATHNAHTVAAILKMSSDVTRFEFQRLHGMGETLHQQVLEQFGNRCRIYAPVGPHEDLLAYLVRRLLENGANSSFVNQIVDESVSPATIAADPFEHDDIGYPSAIAKSLDLYRPERPNSAGFDVSDPLLIQQFVTDRGAFADCHWQAAPTPQIIANLDTPVRTICNPARPDDIVGHCTDSLDAHIQAAWEDAESGFEHWKNVPVSLRGEILCQVANLFEQNTTEILALLCREAGKSLADGVAEIREAVDFLRYYAARAEPLLALDGVEPRGTFVCISPWNFPLAIFTGQIAAALAAGNAVLAKPAEQTPLIAAFAVQKFHQAGVPTTVLQLLPGNGATVGAALVADPRLAGVCFTGSTATAQRINRSMAQHASITAPLIAETGGINAMIVDSTALPEQAVTDIIESAFRSAGQRCSALRVLYVQRDVRQKLEKMLRGAMDLLQLDDPWQLECDVGPVIDAAARHTIEQHVVAGKLLHRVKLKPENESGHYVAPVLLEIDGIGALQKEVFGPVLHLAEYEAKDFYRVLQQVNDSGYGLTFGMHTRVDERVQDVVERVDAGNIYINRNQIGAIVGSQPFGGKKLSGTGPKAGGPHYLLRFLHVAEEAANTTTTSELTDQKVLDNALQQLPTNDAGTILLKQNEIADAIAAKSGIAPAAMTRALAYARHHFHETIDLPGPTGESNRLGMQAAGTVLCLHTGSVETWQAQIIQALALGNSVLACGAHATEIVSAIKAQISDAAIASIDAVPLARLLQTAAIDVAMVQTEATADKLRAIREALATRDGPLVPLAIDLFDVSPLISEKTLCIDTTAAGGNASLLAASA